MTNGLTVCIRYHRGSFDESMQTTNEFCCVGMAKIAIAMHYKEELMLNVFESKTKISAVDVIITHQIWDKRIKSDSFIITINDNAVGHLWYKPEVIE